MSITNKLILAVGLALMLLGFYAVGQAIATYGFHPNCPPIPLTGSCPDTLGSSGGFLGGIVSVFLGIGVAFYSFIRSD